MKHLKEAQRNKTYIYLMAIDCRDIESAEYSTLSKIILKEKKQNLISCWFLVRLIKLAMDIYSSNTFHKIHNYNDYI